MQLDETKTLEEQAQQLSDFVGGRMHGVKKTTRHLDGIDWVEFSVNVPVGYPRGWRTRFEMLKMLWNLMKGTA